MRLENTVHNATSSLLVIGCCQKQTAPLRINCKRHTGTSPLAGGAKWRKLLHRTTRPLRRQLSQIPASDFRVRCSTCVKEIRTGGINSQAGAGCPSISVRIQCVNPFQMGDWSIRAQIHNQDASILTGCGHCCAGTDPSNAFNWGEMINCSDPLHSLRSQVFQVETRQLTSHVANEDAISVLSNDFRDAVRKLQDFLKGPTANTVLPNSARLVANQPTFIIYYKSKTLSTGADDALPNYHIQGNKGRSRPNQEPSSTAVICPCRSFQEMLSCLQ